MAPPTVPIGLDSILSIRAGDSVVWDTPPISHPRYGTFRPDDGWALEFDLVSSDSRITATASTLNAGWRASLLPADTTKLANRTYPTKIANVQWTGSVSKSTDRFTLLGGSLVCYPDPSQQTETPQSEAAEMVALWKSAIKAFASNNGIQSYSIGGRSVVRMRPLDMRAELAHWERRLRAEMYPDEFGRGIEAHFTRPAPVAQLWPPI